MHGSANRVSMLDAANISTVYTLLIKNFVTVTAGAKSTAVVINLDY